MQINLNKIFTFKFARCHKHDENINRCMDKVEEEFSELVDAHSDYNKLRKDFYYLGETTVEQVEAADKEMLYELLDLTQACITMLTLARNRKLLNRDIVDGWKEKQKNREVKYHVE